MARYHERMREVTERHGGTLVKFIGDGVMSVFGVPAVHEDDALRAGNAALEMQEGIAELGLSGRVGVNTGEVMEHAGDVTGDAVNVAARLEQAAARGEVIAGERTVSGEQSMPRASRTVSAAGRSYGQSLRHSRAGSASCTMHSSVGSPSWKRSSVHSPRQSPWAHLSW